MMNWVEILCAVDFSRSARDALETAADLARKVGARLTLVHVHDVPRAPGARVQVQPEQVQQEADEVRRKLDAWRAEAERRTGAPVRAIVESGAPAEVIVHVARSGRFDLLVTGTNARHGLGRLLLGSVAERIVRDAPCPVLVARSPPDHGD
ncbi:universal stress protein [Anaeromyxobacter oryzae]|uniref:Universal stress protein n=1 Tax=Anaeromyxobacter oryzae TaxID=2918170 RepID=A0ABM7WRV1_9BACT|nr:universal stress protein [Anaeromyxobacter oryzae]BDG02207.1 universal stress protein [Anaeromyxobacter oryzae]